MYPPQQICIGYIFCLLCFCGVWQFAGHIFIPTLGNKTMNQIDARHTQCGFYQRVDNQRHNAHRTDSGNQQDKFPCKLYGNADDYQIKNRCLLFSFTRRL